MRREHALGRGPDIDVDKAIDVLLEKVLEKWRREGLRANAPVRRGAIALFERECRCSVPAALADLLRVANGTLRDPSAEFRFLPLEEYAPEELSRMPAPSARRQFVFVDYMDWSWGYAFDATDLSVCIVGTAEGKPQRIAETAEEFLELYVCDDRRLYLG
jgi:hypothetical protein